MYIILGKNGYIAESISNSVKADVNELVRRVSIIESKYGSDYIDMSKWIEGN
jgi:hypothetical protein